MRLGTKHVKGERENSWTERGINAPCHGIHIHRAQCNNCPEIPELALVLAVAGSGLAP